MLVLGSYIKLSGGTGGTVQQIDPTGPYDTIVGIRFNTDGTIETGKAINGGVIAWTAAGFWIENGIPDATYDVRFTNLVQDIGVGDWTTEAAAEDIWIGLGSQRVWLSNSTGPGERQFTTDFEVSKNTGAPPAKGLSSYTFKIDNVV